MTRTAVISRLAVAALAATATFYPGPEPAAQGRRVVIEVRGFAYSPNALAVSPGDVVVWRNMDIVPHTATARDGSWESGPIAAGDEGEIRVTDGMIGAYYCRFHPSMSATLAGAPE